MLRRSESLGRNYYRIVCGYFTVKIKYFLTVVRGSVLPHDGGAGRRLGRGSPVHYQHNPDGRIPARACALHDDVYLQRWLPRWTCLRHTSKGSNNLLRLHEIYKVP